jgi:vitamin B12 transporter
LNKLSLSGLRYSRGITCAAIAAACASEFVSAQARVEPIVVTASRAPETVASSLRDVSVLSGDDLRASGVSDIVDVLQSVPGVEIVASGPGATPSIFIRGANSNHTLVLIDGQRLSSVFSGANALQHLAVYQIERIEIVRGAAASLYGADAVGGVIQIFTRSDAGTSARIAGGEARSLNASARAGFGDASQRFSISASHRSSTGYNAIVDPNNFSYNADRDGYRFDTFQASASSAPSASLKLDATALFANGHSQYDGSADFDDRIKSRIYSASASARYSHDPAWVSVLRIGNGMDDAEFISTFPGRFKTRHAQLTWQNNLALSTTLSLWNALEWRRESVSSTDPLPVTSRRTVSAVIGGDFTAGAFRASPSVRLDDSDQYGSRTTASLSLGYTVSPAWRLSMNGGTSFKPPTFNDLYYPGFANPLLSPEKGRSFEASVRWKQRIHQASVTAYRNNVRDLIQFQCDENFNCAPQNVASARLQGLTFSASSRWQTLNIDANLDLAKPENAATEKWLPRRARVHGALKLSGEWLGVESGVETVASGKRYDDIGNTHRLGGYAVANIYARRMITRNVTVGVRIDNAFDRDYEQARSYATAGRRAWLTLTIDRL